MVCVGRNIANYSKNPQFLPVMCALCRDAPLGGCIFVVFGKLHAQGQELLEQLDNHLDQLVCLVTYGETNSTREAVAQ